MQVFNSPAAVCDPPPNHELDEERIEPKNELTPRAAASPVDLRLRCVDSNRAVEELADDGEASELLPAYPKRYEKDVAKFMSKMQYRCFMYHQNGGAATLEKYGTGDYWLHKCLPR